MNVLLFAEYIDQRPWSAESWSARFARGLAARGHGVTAACDGVFDAERLTGIRTVENTPRRRDEARRPLRFHLWARRARRRIAHDVSLSFTALAPADILLPLGPTALDALGAAWGGGRYLSAAFETVQRPWHAGAAIAERLGTTFAPPRRRLSLSGEPGALGTHQLGLASRWPIPDPPAFSRLRATTRRALGLGDGRTVLLVSAVHPDRPGLPAMLEGLASLQRPRDGAAPVVVIAGPAAYRVHAAGRRARCTEAVRIAGATSRMDALFAACDAAAAPLAGHGSSCTGRFIADALRHGRPVIADKGARGAELLAPVTDESAGLAGVRPGMLLSGSTASVWRGAFEAAMAERWLGPASAAAAKAGAGLSFESVLSRLESVLVETRDSVQATARRLTGRET